MLTGLDATHHSGFTRGAPSDIIQIGGGKRGVDDLAFIVEEAGLGFSLEWACRPNRGRRPAAAGGTGRTMNSLRRLLVLAVLPLLAHCVSVPQLEGVVPTHAIPPAHDTVIDRAVLRELR